jgi:hypothetical protein
MRRSSVPGHLSRKALSATAAAVCVSVGLSTTRSAIAYIGTDAPLPPTCQYTSVTANLNASAMVAYKAYGNCGGSAMSAILTYDPVTQQYGERLFSADSSSNNAMILSTGYCAADPWVTGAPCSDQTVAVQGSTFVYDPKGAPESRGVPGGALIFQTALSNAARPNPPNPPVNFQARAVAPQRPTIQLSWFGPDESGNRPVTSFIIEARPAAAAGAAWTRLGGATRNGSGHYLLTIDLPPALPSSGGWVVHACAVTVFAATCSAPLIPSPPRALDISVAINLAALFALPPPPVNIQLAALGTSVSAAWQAGGPDLGLVDRYVLEESTFPVTEDWHLIGIVPAAGSVGYTAHALRAAHFGSWLRVCAEHSSARNCSAGVQVQTPLNAIQLNAIHMGPRIIPTTRPPGAAPSAPQVQSFPAQERLRKNVPALPEISGGVGADERSLSHDVATQTPTH